MTYGTRCRRQRGDMRQAQQLPVGPLLDALAEFTNREIAGILRISPKTVAAWKINPMFGLSMYAADMMAVRAKLHPSEVWGDAWWGLALA